MASLGDLNHFIYPNSQLSKYQGVQVIEGVLYYTCVLNLGTCTSAVVVVSPAHVLCTPRPLTV